jgi:hypothetical protein
MCEEESENVIEKKCKMSSNHGRDIYRVVEDKI